MLISILRSVMFLLSNNTFVVDRERCEDIIKSEEITTLIEEFNSLFRNFQIGFLKEVLEIIIKINTTFFNEKNALKDCLDKLNVIKLNDENYKKNMVDFFNEIFRVVNNDNNFNCSELLGKEDIEFFKSVDFYSFKLATIIFSTCKYVNFKILTGNEKRKCIRKLGKKVFYLYEAVIKRLNFVDVDCEYQNYEKIKEEFKDFLLLKTDLNFKIYNTLWVFSLRSSSIDMILIMKLKDTMYYYDEKINQIDIINAKINKKELSSYDKDFDAILSNFNIDLKKFMKHGEELQILLNEIVYLLELFKIYLLVFNQKEFKLKDAKDFTKYLILQIKNKISFHKLYDFYESDKVLKMLYEVEKKLVKIFNNLVSNDSVNN
ncbi:hypothetical protein HERIO_2431 [Hepatospora eriocheir]|uniref:Uncharacterized protein n=1 Tax=Hepatospora eriocheir TaxID=1081669 RepID=A0A1X0Q6X4_9MICR|nr:hypothetical protein HERIO_2431 [Hepatospora eriocheir]